MTSKPKTDLSERSKKAAAKTTMAQPEASSATAKQRLGVLKRTGFVLPDTFFDPLPEEELRLWNGEAD